MKFDKTVRSLMWWVTICSILGLTSWACTDATGPAPAGIINVSIDPSANALVRIANIQLEHASQVEVEYWSDDTPALRITSSGEAEAHSLMLSRLRAETEYSYRVLAIENGRRGEALSGRFTTEPLPTDLESLRFAALGRPTVPMVMVYIISIDNVGFTGAVILDGEGEVVWFWRAKSAAHGGTRRANGNFVFLDNSTSPVLVEVSPDGRVISEVQRTPDLDAHHDVIATPQNTLYFIAKDVRLFGGTPITGEAIWEWSPEGDALNKRWSTHDALPHTSNSGPRSVPVNWFHFNSLAIGPRGNIVVSSRLLSSALSLSADFSSIEWRLGGASSTFTMSPDAYFIGQHTAAEIATNRVLLFDNGTDFTAMRAGEELYSRVVEYALDPQTKVASIAWEYRPNPAIYSTFVGSARRLGNGNTLVCFGTAAGANGYPNSGPLLIVEVSPAGQPLWELRPVSAVEVVYRAEPIATISGELPVD